MTAAEAATQALAEFVARRLDEDEAVARAAVEKSGNRWTVQKGAWDTGSVVGTSDDYKDEYRGEPGILWDWEGGFICAHTASVEHIARHDPARVLAEVAAKRAVLELMEGGWNAVFAAPLRHLAAVYSDHPDYRDDWRP